MPIIIPTTRKIIMIFKTLTFISLMALSWISHATPILIGSGSLGVTGVDNLTAGDGTVWNVSFIDGTCTQVYGACGPNNNDFTNIDEGWSAVNALASFLQNNGQGTAFPRPTSTIKGAYTSRRLFGFVIDASELQVLFDDGINPDPQQFGTCGTICRDGWRVTASRNNPWAANFSRQAVREGVDLSSDLRLGNAFAKFNRVSSVTTPPAPPTDASAPGSALILALGFMLLFVRRCAKAILLAHSLEA